MEGERRVNGWSMDPSIKPPKILLPRASTMDTTDGQAVAYTEQAGSAVLDITLHVSLPLRAACIVPTVLLPTQHARSALQSHSYQRIDCSIVGRFRSYHTTSPHTSLIKIFRCTVQRKKHSQPPRRRDYLGGTNSSW